MNKTGFDLKNAAVGFAIGLCNGLFGAGGGVAAVLALRKFSGLSPRQAHATALSVMLPLTALSAGIYLIKGGVDYPALASCAPGILLGGILGAKLTGRISARWLERVFYSAALLAGLWMVMR